MIWMSLAWGMSFGINEAVSVPRVLLQRGEFAGDKLRAHLTEDARLASGLGARLVRGHTGAFPRAAMSEWNATTRAETDLWVEIVQAAGMEPVMMVSPWPANQTANHTLTYVPDLENYRAYVREVATRYRGRGVRYFEFDNEPDLKATVEPKNANREVPAGSFCKPAEYAQVLRVTSEEVRGAGGVLLAPGLFAPHRKASRAWLDELLAIPGVAAAIDIVSVHTYAEDEGQKLADNIDLMQALFPGKPVWVTETSLPADGDEEAHARALVSFVQHAREAGAEALFWHTLVDPVGSGGFSTNSLYGRTRDGVREKAAARAFRKVATEPAP